MKWNNLDLRCAETAEKIIGLLLSAGVKRKEVNKLCIDAGAVLSEHGLYACFLYLWTKSSTQDQIRKEARQGAYGLLAEVFNDSLTSGDAINRDKVLGGIRKLSGDLNSLLLAKRLMSQILAYTRYHAKGMPEKEVSATVSSQS